jgi:DNA polymerase
VVVLVNIITLDFETYFDKDYSLSKLTTEEYVRDPRFEVHGVAIKWPNGVAEWWHDFTDWDDVKLDDCAILCHHAQFDGLILTHHYGVKPAAWLDTLSMSRLLLGNHVKHSLDSLREHFHMTLKSTPYKKFKGLHWDQMSPELRREIEAGAIDEVESIYSIFTRFMSGNY